MTDPRTWEFGQLPLVIGPLIGLRAFRLTADGLTGVHKQVLWGPGENTAQCLATPGEHAAWGGYGYSIHAAAVASWEPHVRSVPRRDCGARQVPADPCRSCGRGCGREASQLTNRQHHPANASSADRAAQQQIGVYS